MIETDELYDRCIELEHIRWNLEDKIQAIIEFLVHSSISIEEMEKIEGITNE